MSTAIVVVVVGACIAVVASVMSSAVEPATRSPAHARAQPRPDSRRRPAERRRPSDRRPPATTVVLEPLPGRSGPRGQPVEPIRGRDRVRAAAALGALATGLGIALAVAFGVLVLVLVALLRRSLG